MHTKHTECHFADSGSWVVLSPIELSIKKKIESVGTPLKDWDINIYRGVLTGFNEAFIISTEKRNEILNNCKTDDERKRTDELIRPILRGRDIKRYGYDFAGLYLIATFPSRHYDIEQYPTVKEHLLTFGMKRLEQTGRDYIVDNQCVKARKKTNNKWFETQDSISYWEDFLKPKIVYNDIAQRLSFALSEKGEFLNNTAYFFTCNNSNQLMFLLKVLNSKLIDWYYRTLSVQLGEKAVRMFSIYVLKLPIPLSPMTINTSEDKQIDKSVYKLYKLTNDEIAVIESQQIQ